MSTCRALNRLLFMCFLIQFAEPDLDFSLMLPWTGLVLILGYVFALVSPHCKSFQVLDPRPV